MIAELLIETKQATNAEDAKAWASLANVLKRLGLDRMSSDESVADDDIHMIYRTKVMPWRRNIERELEIIDTQRFIDTDIYTAKAGQKDMRKR